MSDVPKTDNSTTLSDNDSSLGPRRLVAFIISIVLAVIVVALGISLILHANPWTATFPLAFLNDVPLLPTAVLPMGFFFLIWVDYFMGTRLIPD